MSLKERGIGVQVIELKIEEGEIDVAVEAAFEGLGHGLKLERIEQDLGVWRTKYSGKRVAMATVLSLQIDGCEVAPTMPGPFMWSWHWKDHDFCRLEIIVRDTTFDVLQCSLFIRCGYLALADETRQSFVDPLNTLLNRRVVDVDKNNIEALTGSQLCNSTAHYSCANDADSTRSHNSFLMIV